MKLIVGLGNPGAEHEHTRHNLGFMVIEQFLKDFEPIKKTQWENSTKFKSDIAEIEWMPKHGKLGKVILVRPKTYMNNSGLAVSLISQYLNISISDIWVVHDDIDLPLGSLRIRLGGGTAGHRGVTSVLDQLKTDKFWRFRLGIGHPKRISKIKPQISKMRKDVDDFVLEPFAHDEQGKVRELIKHAAKAVAFALEHDLAAAMNKFNTK